MEVPPHQIFNSNTELYMSMPLSGHLIRVLDLDALPRNSSDSEPLTGQLRIENLRHYRHRPKYTALSYVWGMHSPGYSIRCGNRSLSITPNLSDALVSLRRQFGAMTIWVDAICINQGDEDEKDHQIPLMDVIYSCATTVYIWLGDGTSTSSSDAAIIGCQKHPNFD
jgi:Heterokaryon incompatibility protein (HET)